MNILITKWNNSEYDGTLVLAGSLDDTREEAELHFSESISTLSGSESFMLLEDLREFES